MHLDHEVQGIPRLDVGCRQWSRCYQQSTLTVGGRITVQLVSSLKRLDLTQRRKKCCFFKCSWIQTCKTGDEQPYSNECSLHHLDTPETVPNVGIIEIILTLRENVLFGRFGRKSGSCNKLGCFTRWLEFFLYLKSSKLPLNLLCYTAMPVFFQKWPKPSQPNFLSLGVTMISMVGMEAKLCQDMRPDFRKSCPSPLVWPDGGYLICL